MSHTGTEVFNLAVAMLDELSPAGTVSDAQVGEYKNRAPYLLELWQRELGQVENIPVLEKITSLTQTLQVSDAGCSSGAYYLALHFALSDQNSELAAYCRLKYDQLKSILRRPRPGAAITDVYGVTG